DRAQKVMIDIAKEELNNYDVIISDYRMDAIDGVLINKFLKSKSIITLFILISSFDYAEIKKHIDTLQSKEDALEEDTDEYLRTIFSE
ncbi:hypothetical protein LCGC14_3043430, partial [marine sediment metagenome]